MKLFGYHGGPRPLGALVINSAYDHELDIYGKVKFGSDALFVGAVELMTTCHTEVAVLGPLGTYTHEAAFKTFGSSVTYNEQDSIAGVCQVLSPLVQYGVVPQENSIFGTVIETYDLLRTTTTSFIRGEIILKIDHCLVVKKGVKLHEIRRVMSHEQALGQCQRFLAEKLPSVTTIKTKSTAAAAQALLDGPPNSAAICSSICTELFPGLEILYTGIQNERSNFTRFYIIAHSRSAIPLPSLNTKQQMKGLLRVTSSSASEYTDFPADVVAHLTTRDIVIGRIDRRPSVHGAPFSNMYFVEVHAPDQEEKSPINFETWSRKVDSLVSAPDCQGKELFIVGIW